MDQACEEMARCWQRLDVILTIDGSKKRAQPRVDTGKQKTGKRSLLAGAISWRNIGGVQCLMALYVSRASFNTLAGW